MPPAKQNLPIVELGDRDECEQWLEANHSSSDGAWLKFAKKNASRTTVTKRDALELALCFGWIDGQVAAHDESYWLTRFTPRRPRSKWSQINRDAAEKLIADGKMRPAGLAEVEAAKADGRWDAAYEPQSRATVPADFQKALDENPKANEFFKTLKGVNRYAFIYRINDAKRPETRAKRIAQFVEMLNARETFYG